MVFEKNLCDNLEMCIVEVLGINFDNLTKSVKIDYI